MSRAYTKEEAREQFLNQLKTLSSYWSGKMTTDRTIQERCDGLVFSILSMIDGCSVAMPCINLSIIPHPDDKAYLIANGEKYYEHGLVLNDDCALHELYVRNIPEDDQSKQE